MLHRQALAQIQKVTRCGRPRGTRALTQSDGDVRAAIKEVQQEQAKQHEIKEACKESMRSLKRAATAAREAIVAEEEACQARRREAIEARKPELEETQ